MNKGRILLFALVALFASSCVKDLTSEPATQSEIVAAKKIINTSENAVAGELVLFVDEETADLWASSAEATRSGSDALNAAISEFGATSIEPVFNMAINGAEKRAYGLHRWYVAKFDEEANLEVVAEKFAAAREVKRVQYSTALARPQVRAVPVSESVATRADGDMPFNDPMLELQWHYDNQGLQSLFPGAVKGEDINAFAAWKHETGNRDIIVAVVDEGVKYDHPDLVDNMWVNEAEKSGQQGVDDDGNGVVDDVHGYCCSRGNGNITWNEGSFKVVDGITYWDGDVGHGTHVAGTVAAVNNNGIGVSGVAGGTGNNDGVRIMSIQIFNGDSGSTLAQNAKGIEYAADNGACILQNSWGYPLREGQTMSDNDYQSGFSVELSAIRYFVGKSNCSAMQGNIAIFAAGNDGKATADYPGAYNEFIAVTAYAPDGLPTSYTNYKYGCNVSAPGGDLWVEGRSYRYEGTVLSTLPSECIDVNTLAPYGTDYGYMQGTSMACPHVSGIAALVLSYALDNGIMLTNTQLNEIITSSVRNIDDRLTGVKPIYIGNMSLDPYKGNMGTGKIDALMAIQSVRGALCVPAHVGEEVEINISSLLGDGNIKVTGYSDYVISPETRNRLDIKNDTYFSGKVYLTCHNAGVGVITVKYIAGGNAVGGGNTTGGKLMEKDIVLVVRDFNNNAGWM
ncbi:MAG: S8 family serine peptidase [Alistipes sp.]|nr:S8 family serine peptidase [Alistipes sp.]MBR3893447.1 S8 family serine peptidase [Alistipes sp.]MBR6630949.1 S8 family serine peptidase [Alistipes sp.]